VQVDSAGRSSLRASGTLPVPEPPLAEGAVALRPLEERDGPAIERGLSDPDVIRAFGRSALTAGEVLDRNRALWQRGEAATFAVCERSGDCAGLVFLNLTSRRRATVGYWLLPEARGKGLAATAVRLVSRWALRDPGLARVGLLTEPWNEPSQRVAELAGFRREGVLRSWAELDGRRVDYVSFSLLPNDLADTA
jgi:ribosomal-protein-alanine N-acetyltransferase